MVNKIRNFCIIAHIDHGKSTLADRLIEVTGTVSKREMEEQYLDNMDIEKERGITIKAQTVRLTYHHTDGEIYNLNLIDTPGHVDFAYEVSRSIKSCEGALLVVDASQGVEAQTLANLYLALEHNLEIIPVINKIDLPGAMPEKVEEEIEQILGLHRSEMIRASAKTGEGIADILAAVVDRVPAPKESGVKEARGLIFDSWFDSYQGVITLVRMFDGKIKRGDKINLMHKGSNYEVIKIGVLSPKFTEKNELEVGEVGCLICGIKNIRDIMIGDTVTTVEAPAAEPLSGFKDIKPMVFAGIYPIQTDDYDSLKEAIEKLHLNDSSFTYEPEKSNALGFGFRCGFLGLLHMEVFKERLEREYELDLICTAPSVIYKVFTLHEGTFEIDNPSEMPDVSKIAHIEEPFVTASVHCPNDYIGAILALCEERRGVQRKIEYLTSTRVLIQYDIPLNEVIFDFFDRMKSATKGYGSLDYELLGYQQSNLVKLDILINGDAVDALSVIVHKEKAYYRGRELVTKLRGIIERQMFEVIIQAAIGGKIVAKDRIAPFRKNVIAKCYGGDITRKRKLLEKQKEGKKRMKQIGAVEVPQEAFLAVLKVD